MFWTLSTTLSVKFLIVKIIQRDIVIILQNLHVKHSLFLYINTILSHEETICKVRSKCFFLSSPFILMALNSTPKISFPVSYKIN